jgi:hypothetical protein
MRDKLEQKLDQFVKSVTDDQRWDLQDELMIQVLGFTLYGLAFGLGRLILFMDVEEIDSVTVSKLTELGIGQKYAQGLVEAAFNSFSNEDDDSVYSLLVGVGHSNFAEENLNACKESIFSNTEVLRENQP